MKNYLEENEEIIDNINNIIIKRIKIDNILKRMYEDNYIKNDHIDIVSTLTKYMLNIYKKYVIDILEIIENNYFLTTLMVTNSYDESSNSDELSKISGNEEEEKLKNEEQTNPDKEFIENKIIEDIKTNYISLIENKTEIEKYKYNNIICLLYKIPGLFNLYQEINDYFKENIKSEFYQNEKKFRLALPKTKDDKENLTKIFHDNEELYLDKIYNYLNTNELFKIILNEQNSNERQIFKEFIDLFLKDYITFYLFRK